MKTPARWIGLAAIALAVGSGGDVRDSATMPASDSPTAEDEEIERGTFWRRFLPVVLQALEPADPTDRTTPTDPTGPTDPTDPTDPTTPPDPTDPTGVALCSAPEMSATPPPASVGTLEEERALFFTAVGEELIAPGYAAFAEAAQALATTTQAYCAAPGNDDAALHEAWKCAMTAWQRMQHLRVGPVEEDHRRLRIQFFPDGNSAVQRNLDGLLGGTAAITEDVVRNTPAGAQGLPALERLIFEETLAAGSRRCEAAQAIAGNLRNMAEEVAAPWQAGGALVAGFVNGSDPFLSGDDVLVAILESLVVQAEFVADRKILPGLRTSDADALESPLSMHSKENIVGNVDALAALVGDDQGSAYRLRAYLLRAHDETSIGGQLGATASDAQARLAALAASLEAIVGGQATADRKQVQALFDDLQTLSNLGVDASVAAGVNLGFNSEDGD